MSATVRSGDTRSHRPRASRRSATRWGGSAAPASRRTATALAAAALLPVLIAPAASAAQAAAAGPTYVVKVGHAFPAVPATARPDSIPVLVHWRTTGDRPICRYQVDRFKEYAYEATTSTTSTQHRFDLEPFGTYRFEVYPVFCDGVRGFKAGSEHFFADWLQEDHYLRSAPGWQYRSVPAAIGGRLAVTQTRGASFSGTVCGRNWAWFAQTGPQGGRARVEMDGVVVATADLYSPTVRNRQLVAKHFWPSNTCQTVTVTNTSTSTTRNRVTLDALAHQEDYGY